ncbi:DUF3152 domain-containing protein [Actinoplanes sp. NPDC023801]|uniref:DUF3152 domain-containing protein n=1 Tax=Actinoplanes sp. NPDC023801 TaxID=3154595 RepID=UPI003411DC9E
MANATNGPVDPDAGPDRRGRAERSRAETAAASGTPAATSPRRRTVAATTTTGRAPVTAPAEPARRNRKSAADEPARKPAGKKSTPAAETAEPPAKPAAVKSTSARTATGRAPARKTATAPVEPVPEEPQARRRSTARTTPAEGPPARRVTGSRTRRAVPDPEPATPALSGPESPDPPAPAREMTRGIFELAAERLAASTPRPVEPPPPAPAGDDPLAAPGSFVNPRAVGGRRSTRSGTGPGIAGRTSLGSRPPGDVRSQPDHWDGLSPENGWLGVEPPAVHAGEQAVAAPGPGTGYDEYPRTMNRPIGLPPSVRLPAELPDNLWPPKSMLERNLTENIYVPAPVPPRPEEPAPAPVAELDPEPEAVTPRPRPVEIFPEEEPESDFLPSVLTHAENDYVPAHARSAGQARHAVSETAGARRVRRRRRLMLLAYILLVVLILIAGHELRDDERPLAPGRDAAQRAAEPAGVGPAAGPVPQMPQTAAEPQKTGGEDEDEDESAPKGKAGEFGYAKDRGPALGSGGRLYRFRVAVEKVVEDTSAGEFAEAVDETLGDERSWIHDGRLRLRRVPKSGDFDFTIYLASAKTSERMCASGGLDTEGYTSCRVSGQVIINADRWADAVPDYEGELEMYRRYTINHEVGHEFGHGHEACPGKGEPAPVMMQQTLGLKGCTPNPWPYLDGERYAGEPVA